MSIVICLIHSLFVSADDDPLSEGEIAAITVPSVIFSIVIFTIILCILICIYIQRKFFIYNLTTSQVL